MHHRGGDEAELVCLGGEARQRQRLHAFELNPASREVDPRHGGLVHRDVVLVVHEVADRMPDAALVQQPSRELVQQRLEGVVVVPVDEDDVDIRVLQSVRSADACEASSEDEDAWTIGFPPSQHAVSSLITSALVSPRQ